MNISENIITKLFDTLKTSIDDNEKTLDKYVNAQINNMNYLKPKIIKIEEYTEENLGLTKKMSKKVGTMILVVVIAFALMTSAYFIVRGVHDLSNKQYEVEQKID